MERKELVEQHIDSVLASLKVLFNEAAEQIESMQIDSNDKKHSTTLVDEIAKKHGYTMAELYPVMQHLFKSYPNLQITKGRYGGMQLKSK